MKIFKDFTSSFKFSQVLCMNILVHALFHLSPVQLQALENPQPVRSDSTTSVPPDVSRFTTPAHTLEFQKDIFNQPSPVEKFRALLTAGSSERERLLAEYEADARLKIRVKIQEYENLSSELRFNRLMATELRWYLPALLKFEKDERLELVEKLDPKLAQLVLSRVDVWDQLPAAVKNSPEQKTLIIRHLCKSASSVPPLPENGARSNSQPPTPTEPPVRNGTTGLSKEENQRIQRLQLYFGLSPEEKKEMLKSVEGANDSSFLNRLQWLEAMPEGIRNHALRQLVRLQELSDQERHALGETLRAWNQLSAEQKSSLRQLLEKQPPSPGLMPIRSQRQ